LSDYQTAPQELTLLPARRHSCIIHGMNIQSAKRTSPKATAEPAPAQTDEPMLVLLDAARRIECRLDTALSAVGLSIAKYQALDILVKAGQPLALGELAGSLDCVRSNVTQLADRLESDGLVERVSSPSDRRAVHAVVTPLGRTRHAAGAAATRDLQSELAAQVDPADRAMFHRVLTALR
jgi:DNA-binding MarR family transcriptional regulator